MLLIDIERVKVMSLVFFCTKISLSFLINKFKKKSFDRIQIPNATSYGCAFAFSSVAFEVYLFWIIIIDKKYCNVLFFSSVKYVFNVF